MQAILPLETMSVTEKLRMMETLWRDLSEVPASIESPSWHERLLRQRQQQIDGGEGTFVDWEEAKERIRQQVA